MTKELNYLSEKIERLENNLVELKRLSAQSSDYKCSQRKVKTEKEVLENILNYIKMNKIIVVKAGGKGRENASWITVKLFDTYAEAYKYIEENNDLESKYWTYCEIVQDGEEIEPFYGTF